ncbi:MAG TPA: DUF4424 family protein [Gammaproteobacteria bacterium]|jgi:hypothetical protein
MNLRYLQVGVLSAALGFCHGVLADDGIAEVGAGGIVFLKSADVSMDKEVLEISPDQVDVSYVFANTSGKDIDALVAFPVPPIQCDSFGRDYSHFMDDFAAYSDGRRIDVGVETKAFVWVPPSGGAIDPRYHPGQEVTGLLEQHALPTDCRKLGLDQIKQDPKTHQNHVPKAYQAAVDLGLASDAGTDPGVAYYETRLKYFWHQSFPAGNTVNITHSYHPATGEGQAQIPKAYYPDYYRFLDKYRHFFASNPQLAGFDKQYDPERGYTYRIVKFVLVTANTWKGPIKDFKLILPKPKALIVPALDGDVSLEDGHLVIEKKDFTPTEDLTVFFIDPV